jgi:hypothetical protein
MARVAGDWRSQADSLVTLPGYLVDFGLPYDLNGDPAGPMRPVERLGEATLGMKRGDTRLTALLKKPAIRVVPICRDHDPSLL